MIIKQKNSIYIITSDKIQNTKYKIQNTKYKIQNTKYKIVKEYINLLGRLHNTPNQLNVG